MNQDDEARIKIEKRNGKIDWLKNEEKFYFFVTAVATSDTPYMCT